MVACKKKNTFGSLSFCSPYYLVCIEKVGRDLNKFHCLTMPLGKVVCCFSFSWLAYREKVDRHFSLNSTAQGFPTKVIGKNFGNRKVRGFVLHAFLNFGLSFSLWVVSWIPCFHCCGRSIYIIKSFNRFLYVLKTIKLPDVWILSNDIFHSFCCKLITNLIYIETVYCCSSCLWWEYFFYLIFFIIIYLNNYLTSIFTIQ